MHKSEIEAYYNRQPEREWERLERHRTEFAVTMRALGEYFPPAPARVLDCGGGPGRFSIELARLGYRVTLFDLSSECLDLAREKASEAGVMLASFEHGTATDLARFFDGSFDAVLLMGPLYHLLDQADRKLAIQEAHRVLRPGGTLFAASITRYADHRYMAAHHPTWPADDPIQFNQALQEGILSPDPDQELSFVAYLARPGEIDTLVRDAGMEIVTALGVEGLISMIEEGVNALSGPAWEAWCELNYQAASDPSVHGCVEHLLVVARKPRWRAVLQRIAQRLHNLGIRFKVVGGTAAALHGAPVPVRDIDLEMDVASAYAFGQVFAEHVVERVTLRENEIYRSHFGRFDVDGLMVEVMGDLHRREGQDWIPTATCTETTIELEQTPVPVSWIEEETLAYIRRGRMERAAQCLPLCDRDRLLSLLRGKQSTSVI